MPSSPASPERRRWLGQAGAGLALPWFIRDARAADEDRFAQGIASGTPRTDGMVLWTRLTGPDLGGPVPVSWELAEDEAFTRIVARGTETAVPEDAHCVHAEPRGLAADRWYWYRFRALGQRSPVGRTRTLPGAGALSPLRVVLASCQRWAHGHFAAWRQAAADTPDLVLFVGDYLYEYGRVAGRVREHTGTRLRTLADYRARYALYQSDPLLQAAHAAAPWIVTWDDHEVENDHAAWQAQDLDPAFPAVRIAAYQAYWEHMPLPKALRPREGLLPLYGAFDWGALGRLLVLDDRQYRDPQACPRPGRGGSATVRVAECAALADPARSLLGHDQERWLAQAWRTDTPWNLLVQQTLMARFSWQDPAGPPGASAGTDGWDGDPASRERLLRTVAERRVPGVVVLGGDVHANYVADLRVDAAGQTGPVVATEFCGTSISSDGLPQSRLDKVLPFNPHIRLGRSDQRGYVRLDLRPQRATARLMTVDDVKRPDSPVRESARFEVDPGDPGARPA